MSSRSANLPALRLAPLALAILVLTACGGGESPPPAAPAPRAAPTAQPAAPVQAAEPQTVESLLAKANAALADDRLFEPVGDNAMELYLEAIALAEQEGTGEADKRRRLSDAMGAGDAVSQTRMAVADILPYGLIWVERAIRGGEFSEAERVIGLLDRAQPGSASVKRLRDQLAEGIAQAERQAEREAAAQAAAAARAAQPAAEPAAPPTSTAATPAPPPVAQPAPAQSEPAASQPAATQPAASQPAPAVATPAAPAPAASAPAASAPATAPAQRPGVLPAGQMPRLLSQPTLRYPVQALRRGTEGFVTLSFTINPDGSTGSVKIERADPRGVFDREAIRLIEGLKFEPPGRAIQTERRIDFKMQG